MKGPIAFLRPAPRPQLPEDAPERHQEIGAIGLANFDEVADVLAQVAEELTEIDAPPGFRPLPPAVTFEIIRDLATRRIRTTPGDEAVELAYSSRGTYVGPTFGLDFQIDPRVKIDHLVLVHLFPLPSPMAAGGQYRGRPGRPDLVEASRRDVASVAQWYTNPTNGLTWHPEAPWPVDPDANPSAAAPLTAQVRREIVKICRHIVDDYPRPFIDFGAWVSFHPESGVFLALNHTGSVDLPGDHLVKFRIWPHTEPEDVNAELDKVRVLPSGRVIEV